MLEVPGTSNIAYVRGIDSRSLRAPISRVSAFSSIPTRMRFRSPHVPHGHTHGGHASSTAENFELSPPGRGDPPGAPLPGRGTACSAYPGLPGGRTDQEVKVRSSRLCSRRVHHADASAVHGRNERAHAYAYRKMRKTEKPTHERCAHTRV